MIEERTNPVFRAQYLTLLSMARQTLKESNATSVAPKHIQKLTILKAAAYVSEAAEFLEKEAEEL